MSREGPWRAETPDPDHRGSVPTPPSPSGPAGSTPDGDRPPAPPAPASRSAAAGAAPRPAGDAPHAPERGRLARLLGPFHVTGVFWFRFHGWGARRPEWLKRLLLPLFVGFFHLTLRRIRRAIAANLEPILGPCGPLERERRIWRTLHSRAWSLTERYERLETDLPFEVEVDNRAVWERLAGGDRGLLLVTGHVGNWELASALPASEEGRAIHVVREEELDPRAQRFVAGRLAAMGPGYTTHFAAGDPLLGLTLREALERGEIVALQGDRPRSGGGTVQARLFGRRYALPVGPLALARQAGVPLLPAFVYRLGRRRYRVLFDEPVVVARTRDRERDVAEGARVLAGVLERAVRRDPYQWYVFREVWGRVAE